jgi:hypothetical protein
MKIYIGVGAVDVQALSVQVLKYTLLKHNPEHDLVIESIGETKEFEQLATDWEASYGTVFSLQRFLVPQIASRHDADICLHLDSDMLCMHSLQLFFDMILANNDKVVIPLPNLNFNQPQQTAVFGCVVQPWSLTLFNSNLKDFLDKKINYVDLMRLSFSTDRILPCSYVYNSREYLDGNTMILHFTDLYRQPWVNQFNCLGQVWLNELSLAIEDNDSVLRTVKKAVNNHYCLPSLARFSGEKVSFPFMRDLFYMAPQFEAYAQLRFGRIYEIAPFSWCLKLGVITWVQAIAILHAIVKYRKI